MVSLTFDDGLVRQEQMAQALNDRGLTGTFYVHSTRVQAPGYLSRAQLDELARAGHEIGGHTRTHARLPELHPDEQLREVCGDRAALQALGFAPRSFAYPFHAVNAEAEAAVEECGYSSGRGRAGTAAQSTAPADPYDLRTPRRSARAARWRRSSGTSRPPSGAGAGPSWSSTTTATTAARSASGRRCSPGSSTG
ncbi:polysaccharide deacetylase family protein [Nonomuraea sp. NPDC004297]